MFFVTLCLDLPSSVYTESNQNWMMGMGLSTPVLKTCTFQHYIFGFSTLSLFLSSTPGMELVHCSRTELASHFSSETALQQVFEQFVKPTLAAK